MKVEVELSDERCLVFDGAKTVALWAFDDVPQVYKAMLTKPSAERVLVALVPRGYAHDIKHITHNPYFAEHNLDVYKLQDGSEIYVGS